MSNDIRDLRDTIIPKSDQLNADQLMGGPMTITVTDVRRGSGDEQPIIIHYQGENGRPYRPCKSMRRVLMFAWGNDGTQWIGRSMTLYNKLDVKFGGQEVGGIRISHLSHIEKDIGIALTATRGKKDPVRIKRLQEDPAIESARAALRAAAGKGVDSLKAAWGALPPEQKRAIGPQGCPDEFKRLAEKHGNTSAQSNYETENDANASPSMTVAEVIAAIEAATDTDALDTAYDMTSLIDGITTDDRERITNAYTLRRDALDLA
jgi:hypothetical protein